jgi:hypothetical protein
MRLRASAADFDRERLRSIAIGCTVILEDMAALEADPISIRTGLRERLELMLALIDAALPAAGVEAGCSLPARSFPPRPGDRAHDCRARAPRDEPEHFERSAAMLSGLLPSLADLLAELLPDELAHLDLPLRLLRIDVQKLSVTWSEGPPLKLPELRVTASLVNLGELLSSLISTLEEAAE